MAIGLGEEKLWIQITCDMVSYKENKRLISKEGERKEKKEKWQT